jgi:hypothetical protein
MYSSPVTVAARSKAWNGFVRSNTGIVVSNPARGMDVCVYSVFVLSCVSSGLATGWWLVQGVLPTVYKCKIKEPRKRKFRLDMGCKRHLMDGWMYSFIILDLGTRWKWVVSFTPRPLYPRGNCPPPRTHWIGGWVCPKIGLDTVEKRTYLASAGNQTPAVLCSGQFLLSVIRLQVST